MKFVTISVFAALIALNAGSAFARGHGGGHHSSGHSVSHHSSEYCVDCARDSHGKIQRSAAAKDEFKKMTGYSHGRKGYVIDHIVPLKRGGADAPSNMQWQTKSEAAAKDRWE